MSTPHLERDALYSSQLSASMNRRPRVNRELTIAPVHEDSLHQGRSLVREEHIKGGELKTTHAFGFIGIWGDGDDGGTVETNLPLEGSSEARAFSRFLGWLVPKILIITGGLLTAAFIITHATILLLAGAAVGTIFLIFHRIAQMRKKK